MGSPVWSRYGTHGNKWYQAQVPVSNQRPPYQVKKLRIVSDNWDNNMVFC